MKSGDLVSWKFGPNGMEEFRYALLLYKLPSRGSWKVLVSDNTLENWFIGEDISPSRLEKIVF